MQRRLEQFVTGESGAVAPLVAVSLFALIAVAGIAFDYARVAGMDTELQSAADQAALAAASQLDENAGACARAANAAAAANDALVANNTLFANDGSGPSVDINFTSETTCDAIGAIRFYVDKDATTAATSDANAHFVEVDVVARRANFALTPIVNALNFGEISATARAGLGSAVCKAPPLMICNPLGGGTTVNWDLYEGKGVQVSSHSGGNWSPGNFGFLDAGQSNNAAPDLLAALAFQDAALGCLTGTEGNVDPGESGAIDAINTRFDIYNFPNSGGSTLADCYDGSCPAAANVTKDLVNKQSAPSGNSCKLHNSGWQLPANQFSPRPNAGGDTYGTGNGEKFDQDGLVDAMGLPRDLCHYTSYGQTCPEAGGKVGNGNWARADYFRKYHLSEVTANPTAHDGKTRYQTYLWEQLAGNAPTPSGSYGSGGDTRYQHDTPVCTTGTLDPNRDRRVLTVAIAENCDGPITKSDGTVVAKLAGGSTEVVISDWVDMFFVEPGFNRGNGASGADIYMEIIGFSQVTGGNGNAPQTVRRSVPYLVR